MPYRLYFWFIATLTGKHKAPYKHHHRMRSLFILMVYLTSGKDAVSISDT